jgi:hypothetical protein
LLKLGVKINLVGQHHQLYLGLGADIVMESITLTIAESAPHPPSRQQAEANPLGCIVGIWEIEPISQEQKRAWDNESCCRLAS